MALFDMLDASQPSTFYALIGLLLVSVAAAERIAMWWYP